jgi:MYXO-CTERM domain-containing protein
LEDVRGTGNATSSLTSTLDDFTVAGTIVPEPATHSLFAALTLGGLALVRLHRRRLRPQLVK